jgi:molybdenum cofactor sulfurtransferase
MVRNLYGNPHSSSVAAQDTSKKIESIRLRLLHYFNADPEEFDLVFVANATAGIKLVTEALRESENGFWLGYHNAAHTSIVGMRELAKDYKCFASDQEVEDWLDTPESLYDTPRGASLFAYPAQSNMNGTRFPLHWCHRVREKTSRQVFTLLDAAGLASTAPLNIASCHPDFTVLSLYKIFGFPDLGVLIVRKASGSIFGKRRYFGGGTVDMVTCGEQSWHERKSHSLHEQLEDGSLPIHNILALDAAFDTYGTIFGSLHQVSRHCAFLAQRLFSGLSELHHSNQKRVCKFYHQTSCDFLDMGRQGPVVAFNIRDAQGSWVGTTEVEKLASVKSIQLRTGGLCNPGGVATALNLSAEDLKRNFASGQRCGSDNDVMHGQPTGMIRVSVGPANTITDVDAFLFFIQEFFVTTSNTLYREPVLVDDKSHLAPYTVESLTVYPIKSCSGWTVPHNKPWVIHKEGLAWDREWCLILAGSGAVMSQKRYPKMALIHPSLDMEEGLLRVSFADKSRNILPIVIPLYLEPSSPMMQGDCSRNARVCDDDIAARIYTAPDIVNFFSQALGVACFLGRFPAGGTNAFGRHAKSNLQASRTLRGKKLSSARTVGGQDEYQKRPILLSNESPVLTITRSSLNRLNEQIKANGGKAVRAAAFRANIVLAETLPLSEHEREQPYAEDGWRMMKIGTEVFELLGPCRRCQMVCIDQDTGERHQEPFVTLAKTRRFDGMIFFGQHSCHVPRVDLQPEGARRHAIATISAGDAVMPVE